MRNDAVENAREPAGPPGNDRSADGRSDAIWIDWGNHLRTRSMTRHLGIELFRILAPGGRLRRYASSIQQTVQAVRSRRPRVVFGTNPSIVLGYLLLVLRLRYRFTFVCDAHYVGVHPFVRSPLFQFLLDFLNRHADLVIVTNPGHEAYLRSIGARAYVCPDPLPELQAPVGSSLGLPDKSVFLICSFDIDEPYPAVIATFDSLREEGFMLFVSGRYAKAGIDPDQHPGVRFLGYVSDEDYNRYLHEAAIVMDLTVLDDCLVCGAYEALAAGRPLVLSGSEASRHYFAGACQFTENTPDAIAVAVRRAWQARHDLAEAARTWTAANHDHVAERITSLKRASGMPVRI